MGYKDSGLPEVGGAIGAIGTQAGNFAGAAKEAGKIGKGTGGLLGAAGNFTSGFGKLMGGEEVGQGFLEMIGGVADVAATETKNPWVGAAGPALRGASAGVTMYQNRDQCGIDAPMADNKCYSAMGDAVFAGLEVAYPVAGTLAKWGLDGVGALAGWIDEDYGFSSGSAVGGAIHGGARGVSAGLDAVWPSGVSFSPTGVPMTEPGIKDYTAPDPLEALEAGVAADPDTWPATYRR
jgi:hypothetical protein